MLLRHGLAVLLSALTFSCVWPAFAGPPRPNILFIAIDDLRDWVGYLGNKQVKTPNLDKLAARGVYFTRSYCAAPVCNPSRAALLSGLRPATTGVYDNQDDWRNIIPTNIVTLPLHFKNNGYYVAGAGKIYHDAYRRPSDWNAYLGDTRGDEDDLLDKPRPGSRTRLTADGGVGGIKFAPLNCDDSDMDDYRSVSYITNKLGRKYDQPFFLACGLRKPHMPWNVPKKYYDLYPLDKIILPTVLTNDLDDIPPVGVWMAHRSGDHARILESGRWKDAVQGYLATITFCDAMVGRLIDAFDRTPYRNDTIICLWSDHGWMLGEKEHWRKFALWEEAARAPFIFIVPGMTPPNSACNRTVDYMGIYPTLCDLAGLPIPKHVQGISIKPLLQNPAAPWDPPALTTYLYKNHSVRTERWRYIRYNDGGEELYDHEKDPLEWNNLAREAQYDEIKKALAKAMPAADTPEGGVGTSATKKGKGKAGGKRKGAN